MLNVSNGSAERLSAICDELPLLKSAIAGDKQPKRQLMILTRYMMDLVSISGGLLTPSVRQEGYMLELHRIPLSQVHHSSLEQVIQPSILESSYTPNLMKLEQAEM